MKLIKGNELPHNLKKEVLRKYTYRLTTENGYPEYNPCNGSVPAITDEQWLSEHAFYITNNGKLSCHHLRCEPAYLADKDA